MREIQISFSYTNGLFYIFATKKPMKLPKYLIADNSSLENDIFVIHTEFPRFIINISDDEIEWFDHFSEKEAKENADEIEKIIAKAYDFFEKEMENYD